MSEVVLITIITQSVIIVGLFIGWVRERRKDRLTEEEIEERINKSRLSTIADLQEQLGTATKADGALREELNRIHTQNEQLRSDNSAFARQLADYSETIAENSKTISDLMIEKRKIINEKAIWQKKYLDAMLERDSFMALLSELKSKVDMAGDLRDKVDAMERRLTAVQNDTGRLKKKVEDK